MIYRLTDRLNHWAGKHMDLILPAALVLGLAMACVAHTKDTPEFVERTGNYHSTAVRN